MIFLALGIFQEIYSRAKHALVEVEVVDINRWLLYINIHTITTTLPGTIQHLLLYHIYGNQSEVKIDDHSLDRK